MIPASREHTLHPAVSMECKLASDEELSCSGISRIISLCIFQLDSFLPFPDSSLCSTYWHPLQAWTPAGASLLMPVLGVVTWLIDAFVHVEGHSVRPAAALDDARKRPFSFRTGHCTMPLEHLIAGSSNSPPDLPIKPKIGSERVFISAEHGIRL